MHAEAADLDAVAAGDGLDGGGLAGDADEALAGVALGEEVADVAAAHGGREGDVDCMLHCTAACQCHYLHHREIVRLDKGGAGERDGRDSRVSLGTRPPRAV